MKYALILVFCGVAAAQFQNFDNQRNFNQPPQQPFNQPSAFDQPRPSPFDQPRPSPFDQPRTPSPIDQQRPSIFDQPKPTTRPLTTFNPNNPNKYNSQYNNRNDGGVTILRQYFDEQGNGAYSWGFQNSDGTERQEKIYYKNAGELGQVLVKEGFYTYYDAEGRLVRVAYRADDNGFQILEDTRLLAAVA